MPPTLLSPPSTLTLYSIHTKCTHFCHHHQGSLPSHKCQVLSFPQYHIAWCPQSNVVCKSLWGAEVVEGFFPLFFGMVEKGGKGNEKVCVTNWSKGWGGKLCGDEERREDEGTVEKGKSVKKCRVEGFGRAESALMQTLWGAIPTHTHTPVHSSTASFHC